MPKPLSDSLVDYADGSPKTVQQYAKDVSAFLAWAAEPKLEERKRLGFRVLIFLTLYAGMLLLVKKKIWHRPEAHVSLDSP
jgi:cytochrome c1